MRTLTHRFMLLLALWLPIGQAGAVCCVNDALADSRAAATSTHEMAAHMPCHSGADAQPADEANSGHASCAQLCHLVGAVPMIAVAAPAVAAPTAFAPVRAATHVAHTRPLLRPPALQALL